MRTSTYLRGLFISSASTLLLAACGDAPATVTGGNGQLGGDGDNAQGGECVPETEQDCTCPDGETESRQYCYEGNWLDCNCDDKDGDGEYVPAGDCKPGRYEGEFFGYYFSSFTGATFPIPVWALGSLDGKPGLTFTLNASGSVPVEGVEFAEELEISDGYVKGTADGLFPFEAKLTGKLNCKTKEFRATMKGGYAILLAIPGVSTVDFEGPILGRYDVKESAFPCQKGAKKFPKCDQDAPILATQAVTDLATPGTFPRPEYPSTWDLVEKTTLKSPDPNIPLGGKGYWFATWVGEGTVDLDAGTP